MSTTVMHLMGGLRPSGMERMLVTAAPYFQREGIRGIVIGQGFENPYEDALREAGYEVRILEHITSSIRVADKFRRIVREIRPDIIHIHTERDYLRTALVARWALGHRGGIVRTIHNVFDARGMWRISRFAQAIVADRLMRAITAPSKEVAANEVTILRFPAVILNWVDDGFFEIAGTRQRLQRHEPHVPVAVIVGNCSYIKDHELALRALLRTDHRLIHLGDESSASSEELFILNSLQEQGRLLERGVHSPHTALASSDYFMMPSRHEGMPVALAEALAAGLPALVSDAPGLRWAAEAKGVQMVPRNDHSWLAAVNSWSGRGLTSSTEGIDLSASRGARQYADLYRGGRSGLSSSWFNYSKRSRNATSS